MSTAAGNIMLAKNPAILLLAFGGPDSLDDIEPFLGNILSGRRLSPNLLNEIQERYQKIGGSSPLREITAGQAEALGRYLNKKGSPAKVYIGMRYWSPYIKESLKAISDAGHDQVVAVIMAPHDSNYTVKGYRHDLDRACRELPLDLKVSLISGWYDNKKFQEALSEKIRGELQLFNTDEKTVVIFTPHSLPLSFLKADDPYVPQIMETIEGVTGLIGEAVEWRLAYQSKGMIPGEWLGPSVDTVLEGLPEEGVKSVLLVPVGFCSDHIETLYDVDIVYREKAEKLGLNFARSASLNSDPVFIEGLAERVLEEL